jgi:hypothetical protein
MGSLLYFSNIHWAICSRASSAASPPTADAGELTEAGFRLMGQAYSARLGTVIKIDRRDVFRFSATKLGGASPDR